MSKHFNSYGREIRKRGMTVEIKQPFNSFENSEKVAEFKAKAFDGALKILKRRMVQEGLIRDMRRKEFFESKGQIARKKRKEGERRVKKLAKEAEF